MSKLGKAYLSLFTCILSFVILGVIISLFPSTDKNEPPILTEDEYLSLNCHHNYGEWETTLEPTCTTTGTEKQICSICNYENIRTVSTIAHSYEIFREEKPTCFVRGTAIYKCANCTASYVEDLAPQHTYVIDEAVAPTCTETGLTEGEHCTACGEISIAQDEVEALGHTEVIDEAVASTCTTTGLTEGSHCSVCNTVLVAQTETPKTMHTMVEDERVSPTCTTTGLTIGFHCGVCNGTLIAQQEIPATGHTEEIIPAKSATCTTTGLTEGTYCSVCNDTLIAQQEIPAEGHKNDRGWLQNADGTWYEKCSLCNEILSTREYLTFSVFYEVEDTGWYDASGNYVVGPCVSIREKTTSIRTNQILSIEFFANVDFSFEVTNCTYRLEQTNMNSYVLYLSEPIIHVTLRFTVK